MFTEALDTTADFAVALLIHYSFDLGGHSASELIDRWLNNYPANWVRLAVIEALYQGRYKAISVEQILAFWNRRGQTLHHFNHEFERLICNKFPQMLTGPPDTTVNACPPVPDAVGLGNGQDYSTVVTAQESACATDTHVTTNQMGEEPAHRKSYPTSDRGQRLRNPGALHSLQLPMSENPPPIEQFTPVDEGSYLYTKLKAIAKASVNAPDQSNLK